MQRILRKYIFIAGATALLASCSDTSVKPDYREEMRKLIIRISQTGEALHPGFMVVPQNGMQLLTTDGGGNGSPSVDYIMALDAVGQEELFYGYDNQNNFLSENYPEQQEWLAECRFARAHGLGVLVTDYCSAPDLVADSYNRNDAEGFIDYAAESRELDLIPTVVHNEDTVNIYDFFSAKNFLYMINPNYETKAEYIAALAASHHDVLIIDAFFNGELLNNGDLAQLRTKPQGGHRVIMAYMSIGQAENYRWYWKPFWNATPPAFIDQEDPYWTGNFYVHYWDPAWQNIITAPTDSYVSRVVDAGFDGVYLDLVNAFEYYEDK